MRFLEHARGSLPLERCLVMGIVNRTPDSFYDGGRLDLQESVDHALRLVEEGADILDLGAVKAGPGRAVPPAEEERLLLPLVARLATATAVPLSVETTSAAVARRALDEGAAIVNDISGLSDEAMPEVVARGGAALILVHHGGQLRGRPLHPQYDDVVEAVFSTWRSLAEKAAAAGVARESLVVDAALDFGKTTFHSLELVRRLPEQLELGLPVLVAASRKDVVGETLGLPPEERLEGSLAVAAIAAYLGAAIVRVHDVRETVRTLRMTLAVAARTAPVRARRGLWE
ncbi:MAG TPA: dihydropteroate synthase [Actinomycetota bacterium]|nr:dihydropteroate synthase [Actinomycetota bacterium]